MSGDSTTCGSFLRGPSRTRNVSPTIHEGALFPVWSSKNAPKHSVRESWVNLKSAGLIAQSFPPKVRVTDTVVSQAGWALILALGNTPRARTISVVSVKVACARCRPGDLGKDGSDGTWRSADQGGTSINCGICIGTSGHCDRSALNCHRCTYEGNVRYIH